MENEARNSLILLCKTFLSRSKNKRHPISFFNYNSVSHFDSLQELRRLRCTLNTERLYFLKSMTQFCTMRKRRRSPFWWEQSRNKFTHDQWLKYLRMGKTNFYILLSKIKPYLQAKEIKNISFEKQTAITLISFSSGKSNLRIAKLFLIKRTDVIASIENVSEAIKSLMPEYLRLIESSNLKTLLTDFESKWGFPECAGVLGSIHIPLHTSNLPDNSSDYLNTNNSHSIILQGIVDASYKFWDINVGWPGSVSESRVFTSSQLWVKGQDRQLFPDVSKDMRDSCAPIYILAGTSYPLTHWVLRPFLNDPTSEAEKTFNEKFAFAYNACEIAFKRLKARWTCLVRGDICSMEIFPSVVAACCILHNICEMNKEQLMDGWIAKADNYFKQPISTPCNTVIGPQAESIRQAVAKQLMNSKN